MLQLKMENGVWYAKGTIRKPDGSTLRVRKSTKCRDRMKAYAVAAALVDEVMNPKDEDDRPAGNVQEIADLYLHKEPKPGVTDAHVVGRFVERFGKQDVSQLRGADINDFVRERGLKPSSARREIATIKAVLNYAKRCGYAVPQMVLDKPRIDETRERWLDVEQRDAFLDACDGDIQPIATFLFHTGARLGEAQALQWRDVTADFAVLKTRKSGGNGVKKRQVPMNQAVKRSLPKRQLDGKVFCRADGGVLTRKHIYAAWKKACAEVGLEDFNPHDARHTFASLLVQKGISVRVIADMLGHSSLAMMMRYSHISPTQLTHAVELL